MMGVEVARVSFWPVGFLMLSSSLQVISGWPLNTWQNFLPKDYQISNLSPAVRVVAPVRLLMTADSTEQLEGFRGSPTGNAHGLDKLLSTAGSMSRVGSAAHAARGHIIADSQASRDRLTDDDRQPVFTSHNSYNDMPMSLWMHNLRLHRNMPTASQNYETQHHGENADITYQQDNQSVGKRNSEMLHILRSLPRDMAKMIRNGK